jgi:para-aminobenzoate synthetase component I
LKTHLFHTDSANAFLEQLIEFSKGLGFFILLDSNKGARAPQSAHNKGLHLDTYDWLAAFYPKRILSLHNPEGAFDLLGKFHQNTWLVGYMAYPLKADAEKVPNTKSNNNGFAAMEFVEPGCIIYAQGADLVMLYEEDVVQNPHALLGKITAQKTSILAPGQSIDVKPVLTRAEYIQQVNSLKNHIQLGDIYEANFCMEFKATGAEINPYDTYKRLNAASPMPFSAFVKTGANYLLCASPERFAKKLGNTVYSQPIKGTAPRGVSDEEDQANIQALLASEKERSENVMIVDLVRNDLGRTAQTAGVKVDELFGVYHFPKVHHLISTISAEIAEGVSPVEVLKKAFPMGSMTGAPKIRAMQLIEEHEAAGRGLFSGSVGYITPEGDFDFNVVIRSIFYNVESKNLSYWAGSAITAQASAEDEYEECMLKLEAIRQVLG